MSKEVDERVVEMRFDNQHFEKNVQTSMSTLDKFNQKLQFKNASKGFDDIDKAAKKTDLSPLAKSADTVGLRFNAMYTIADQAFRNITNTAMVAGKRIVDAFTIDPVKTGLNEYETKINAVQVIKANTRGKFDSEEEQMETIYTALGELNEYADRTIYNFAQMTDNVGKFVAQTSDIDKSVKAVQGLANLAGASGASAADMARATYQMSQALGGTIRKIDWNSLRNANMAGQELKNMLTDLARAEGVDIDSMIANKGTFEETLEEGWLTGDLFLKAMNIYSDAYSEAELAAMGFNDAQIANFKDLANTAKEATTEVKTFSQLFDVLKETAQSGWTQTWELIIGDFAEAKSLLTPLGNALMGIINRTSDLRNRVVEIALDFTTPWRKITDKLNNVKKAVDSVTSVTDKLEYFQDVVNRVWMGEFNNWGDNPDRRDLLTAAGYDQRVVQELVNLGEESWQAGKVYKLSMEEIAAAHEKFGLTMEIATDQTVETTEVVEKLSDEQLKNLNLTEEEIALYRALEKEAERLGISVSDLADNMSKNNGRDLLIESFKNIGTALMDLGAIFKNSWKEIFNPPGAEELGIRIYGIIHSLKEFTKTLSLVDKETGELTENGRNIQRTLKGIFAALDIILTVIGGPLKIVFKLITQLLGMFDLNILSVTASIGDMIVGFRDTIDSALDFTGVLNKIVPPIQNAIKAFMGWIDTLKESKNLPQDIANGIISWFGKAYNAVIGWFKNLGTNLQNGFSNVSDNAILGLLNGLWNGLKVAGEVIVELGTTLINKICEVLGIHSPSTVFFAIGGFIVSGLLLGIKKFFPDVWTTISDYALECVDIIKNIDFGAIFSALLTSVTSIALIKFADAIQNFSGMFDGLGEMLEDVGKGLKSALKGLGASFRAKAIKDIAISLLLLAGALAVLAFIPTDRLIAATVAIGVLGIVLGGLFIIINKFGNGKFDKESFSKIGALLLVMIGIAASIAILAKALETVSTVNFADNWVNILAGIAAMAVMLGVVLAELIVTTKFIKGIDFGKFAVTIAAIAGLLLVMSATMKILSGLDNSAFGKAITFVTAFGAIAALLAAISNKNTNMKVAQTGSLIKRVGVAMLLMAVACKIIGTMSWTEMGKAAVGIIAFTGIVTALVLMTKLATDKDVASAGKLISGVGTALLFMALAGKIISGMSWEEMWKAVVGIAALSAIVSGLILVTKLASDKELARVGTTIVMASIAVGVLALIASVLGFMPVENLAKGVTAVTILGAIMALMIFATSKAQNCLGNLIVMTIAIGIMASSVVALSMLDTSKLLTSVGAMVSMMGMFAVMIASTKFINNKALVSLITLTAIIAALTLIVTHLSHIDGEKAIISTVLLISLMGAMTALLVVLTFVGSNIAGALLGIVGLTAMLIPLWAFALSFANLPSMAGKEKDIRILTGVMTVMTVLLLAIAAVGVIYMATCGIAATGLIGLAAMAGLMWVFSLALSKLHDFSDKEELINMLIGVMNAMTKLLVVLAIVGPLVLIGVTALAGLSVLMTMLIVFATSVGYLMSKFPDLQKFLDTGIPVLEQLAHGLGSIVSNFLTGLLSGLPEVGTLLSSFMSEAQGFFDGIKMVDGDALKGVAILVGAFTALTAMDFISGIREFFSGGESPFASFAKGLLELSDPVLKFAESMKSFTDDDLAAVKRGAEALKVIAEAAAKIPNSGGVAGFFAGENDLDAFIKMIVGDEENKGIKDLIDSLSDVTIDESVVDDIKLACEVIAALTESAGEIPNSGGMASWFAGNNDLDDFIQMIVGTNKKKGIKELVDTLSNIKIDDSSTTKIGIVIGIISSIIDSAVKLKGNTSSNFVNLGVSMKAFVGNFESFIKKMSKIATTDITDAISKVSELIDLCGTFTADSVTNISNFGEALSAVSKGGIDKFIETFNSTTSTEDVKKSINKFLDNVVSKVKTKANKNKFSNVGKYLVEGLRDGITKNTSLVTKAVRNVVNDALKAAQDEADINSPSIVFNKEVGRYIVQGIAEGITKDMSAEEAAKKKAQNIVTAFQNEIDKHDINSTIAQKELELWGLGDGKKASSAEKELKQLDYLNGELSRKLSAQTLRRDEWKETSKYFAANSKEEREAWSKYLDAQKEVIGIQTQITDLVYSGKLTKIDRGMEMLGLTYENWLVEYPDAKQSVKHFRLFDYLDLELGYLKDKEKIHKEYLDKISGEYSHDSAEYIAAYETWVKAKSDVYAKEEEISDTHEQHIKELEEADDRVRETEYELWLSKNRDVSEQTALAKEREYLEESLKDAEEDAAKDYEEYLKIVEREGDMSAEAVKTALANWQESSKKEADIRNKINDNTEASIKAAEEAKSIASDIAKLKYDIWKNTEGRDATDAEKEMKQLEYLNQQLLIQNQITNESMREYSEAVNNHGSDSIEASRAYKAYLNEAYDLAELKNSILDLEESSADRQKRLRDKQDLAQTEYEDYIKRYEKYYKASGMSRADLEKDAKLVSGYDPNNVVKKITSKTKSALETATTSEGYQSILSGFSDMGMSYVKAIGEGVTSQTDVFMSTTLDMVNECREKLLETYPEWFKIGVNLIDGFIQGVRSRRIPAIEAVYSLATQMIETTKRTFGIASPSKEFAEVGKYSILGLVNGLLDNSGLSDEAAARVGDSAIENLKASIRKISDVVNSDLDTQPTIRPVLDLSNVRSGMVKLNAMTSTTQAMAISNSRKARERSDENQNGNNTSTNTGNTYQFTQNNYSPKALSRSEIYRQTKNQFAAMKEVLA